MSGLGVPMRVMINHDFSRLVREKRRAGIRQHYKSVMKFWQYDLDPVCKKDKKFQTYQTKIKKNLVVENLR